MFHSRIHSIRIPYVVIDDKSQIVQEIQYIDSSNVVNECFERILDTYAIYKDKMDVNLPLVVTPFQESLFQQATIYHICNEPFKQGQTKVRDHCHR